jgi:hypothetical protein
MISECKGITVEQLNTTNGCGSSFWLFWIFRIPKWFSKDFYCSCCCHDLKFQDKTKLDLEYKYQADDQLYDDMYYSAYHDNSVIKKWLKIKIADLTYSLLATEASELCWYEAKRI